VEEGESYKEVVINGSVQRKVNKYGIRGAEVRRGSKTRRALKWKPLDNGPRMCIVAVTPVAMRLPRPGLDVVQPRSGGESESFWENNTPLSLVFRRRGSHVTPIRDCGVPNGRAALDWIFADHRRWN